MKRLTSLLLGIAVFATTSAQTVKADTTPPGMVDFGKFSAPTSGGEFVEVNISSALISLATKFVEKEEPEVAQLLGGLQSVHVAVIGVNDDNRSDLEKRSESIRKQLNGKGWERVVTAQKDAQDVSVFLKMENKDTIQGLVVMVMDGKEHAVFVNVVGDIKPDKLALLGEKLHIDPLKKLGKLGDN
jgi:hypothetical protein